MDKTQAYYYLWSQFGMPAYDENSVPDDETFKKMIESGVIKSKFPYITYQVIVDDIDYPVFPSASVWYRSESWEDIDLKMIEISGKIGQMKPIKLDNGYMYVTKGTPWAQRMADEDRTVKRYVLNLGIEFLTEN